MNRSIIYVHSSLPVGGAEVLRKTVACEMQRRGLNFRVCLISAGGEIAEELARCDVQLDELGCSNSIYKPLTTLRLAAYFRQHRPDIVQSSQFNSNYHTRIAARLAGIPVVICEEHGLYTWKHAHHYWLDRKLANWCDRIIAVSVAVNDFNVREVGIPADKMKLLPNCLDVGASMAGDRSRIRAELGIAPEVFLVGHVGTLRKEKGHDTLLEAFAQFSHEFPAKLLLVGDGPLRGDLQLLAERLNLVEKVIFTGTRRDVPALLQAMDIFAFPSRNEALGIALLDAMYQGLPVVASRVGGIPEIVTDEVTGLLVDVDDPVGIAVAMSRLASDTGLCQRLGKSGREHVLNHHLPGPYVDRLLDLYDEILTTKGRA